MVNVGSLSIVGTINVENIKSGLTAMKRGLNEAKASAQSAFGDMSRLAGVLGPIGKVLGLIGGAVSSAFLAAATMAPQVAPHLARMQADFFRLSTIVGDVLEPVFARFADMFSGFVDWVGSEQGRGQIELLGIALDGVANTVEGMATLASSAIEFTISLIGYEKLKWLVDTFGVEIAAGILGFSVGGPIGAAVGAGGVALARYTQGEGPLAAWENYMQSNAYQTYMALPKGIRDFWAGLGVYGPSQPTENTTETLMLKGYEGGMSGEEGIRILALVTSGMYESEMGNQTFYKNANIY
jgi:hypothetical protein